MTSGEFLPTHPSTPEQAQELASLVQSAVDLNNLAEYESHTIERSLIPEPILSRFTDDYILAYDEQDLKTISVAPNVQSLKQVSERRASLGAAAFQLIESRDLTTTYSIEVKTFGVSETVLSEDAQNLLLSMFGPPEETDYDLLTQVKLRRKDTGKGLLAYVAQGLEYSVYSHTSGAYFIHAYDERANDEIGAVVYTNLGRALCEAQAILAMEARHHAREVRDLERLANGEPTTDEMAQAILAEYLTFIEDNNKNETGSAGRERTLDEAITEERIDGEGVISTKEAAALIELVQRVAKP